PPACDGCGNTWCIDRREEYYLRRVPPETLLEGGEYRRTGGFKGYGWKTFLLCALDECPYWYIDPAGGAARTATATPGPSPTAASPTITPAATPTQLPIEDDAWETRCRNQGGNCSATKPTEYELQYTRDINGAAMTIDELDVTICCSSCTP
ncbi:MAG: hypothetical protein ACE5EL_04605, partial [Anaerolineae bacterium]